MHSENEDVNITMNDKKYTIVINAREHEWLREEISYEQVVVLAFGTFMPNNNTVYSISYKRGHGNKAEGLMVRGDVIRVKDKMIFNVSATDKS